MTRFDRLGEHIAREQDALREKAGYREQVRERLETLELAPVRETHAWGWVAWSGGAAAVMATGVLIALSLRTAAVPVPAPALALFIGQASEPAPAGRWVEAPDGAQVAMRFSDGSHIEVAEHTRTRVVDLNPAGADVLLESGLIHVQVRHRAESKWHISAGPFGVHVTGTRFDVRWKPEEDAFELTLKEGQVEVTGCVFGQGYRMQAGHTVRASCRNERFEVSQGSTTTSVASQASDTQAALPPTAALDDGLNTPPEPADSAVAPEPTDSAAQRRAAGSNTPHSRRGSEWQALARANHFAAALTAAKAAGFAPECNRANAEELELLADLARYGRDAAGEGRALRLLRTRFAGTKRASLAAFALGKLEFDNHGAYAEAAEWFRVYLKERPKGELSREANGRLLEATLRSGRSAAARELAAQYLRDYPDGPHSELARNVSVANSAEAR
jgi:ferric-dicitrate binding protein FerR (iron transport regulator)